MRKACYTYTSTSTFYYIACTFPMMTTSSCWKRVWETDDGGGLGEKQGNIPALELTEQSGHKLLSQDRVSSTRYLKPRLLLHVQDQLGTLYLLYTTYSKKKFSMYYRMDTNTTALLIRAACGNFLDKSPLFVANIWLQWSKLAQIWMQRHQKSLNGN